MKSKVNLTIDDSVLKRVKRFAELQHVSLSEIVENYFRSITSPAKAESFTDMVDALSPRNVPENEDLKALYYESKNNGY